MTAYDAERMTLTMGDNETITLLEAVEQCGIQAMRPRYEGSPPRGFETYRNARKPYDA